MDDRIVLNNGDAVDGGLRSRIVANALWGVRHASQIHYAQTRPVDGLHRPRKLPLTTDCSGFVTVCYAWAHAPDPNGRAYDGGAFTGYLLHHCTRIKRADARPGDLVVFGPGGGEHVVIIVGAGRQIMVVSHGQEAGPLELPLRVEAAAHRRPVRYLRCPGV